MDGWYCSGSAVLERLDWGCMSEIGGETGRGWNVSGVYEIDGLGNSFSWKGMSILVPSGGVFQG